MKQKTTKRSHFLAEVFIAYSTMDISWFKSQQLKEKVTALSCSDHTGRKEIARKSEGI